MSTGIQYGHTTAPGSATTLAVSGLGFTPVAVIFWLTERTSVTTGADGDATIAYGFSDGTNEYGAGTAVDDGGGLTFRGYASASAAIHMRQANGTLLQEATVLSFDAGGFTLSFTTSTAAVIIHYLAIGGVGVSAKVGTIASPGSATTVESSSLGFQPVGLFFAGAVPGALPLDTTSAGGFFGAASATGTAEIVSATWGKINSGSTDPAQSLMFDTKAVSQDTVMNNDEHFTVSALGSDTFTLNFSTSSNTMNYGFLALAGVNMYVTHDESPAATGADAITGAGFQPTGALLFGTGSTSAFGTDDTGGSEFAIGGVDDEGNEGYIVQQNKAGSPADGNMVVDHDTGSVIGFVDVAGTGAHAVVDEASLTSFDADGMTLNWDTADANTRLMAIVMLKGGAELSGFTNGIVFSDGVDPA
jgi:hypothetical protein